jgi:tetratricopeptide (TPR) repeat protein
MNRAQWITAAVAILLVVGLFATTQKKLFGPPPQRKKMVQAPAVQANFSIDSLIDHAKTHLSPEQVTHISFLENSISRGDVRDQQLHVYHELARFWRDTVSSIEPGEWQIPFAWYTAEAARLENSEKSLTFAAHLFLNNLVEQSNPQIKQWEAFQAKDLFERSLKLDPQNDSSKVGLGAVLIYGGIAMPMEGIGKIREVADRDPANIYAQMAMGEASLTSGQYEKALDRFRKVAKLQPDNLQAIFRAAETSEQLGKKKEAAEWYGKLLPHVTNDAMKKEVEARIAALNKLDH